MLPEIEAADPLDAVLDIELAIEDELATDELVTTELLKLELASDELVAKALLNDEELIELLIATADDWVTGGGVVEPPPPPQEERTLIKERLTIRKLARIMNLVIVIFYILFIYGKQADGWCNPFHAGFVLFYKSPYA